jgi:group I intron endonuclease
MAAAVTNSAIVYQATNAVNGHRYIGFTTQGLEKRRYQHVWAARKGSGYHFHNALRKYGAENFVFEVLGDFDDDDELAKLYECEAIAKYRPEYNLTYGGEGGTMHPTTRKKIGEANSRRIITDEIRKNLGDAQRGTKRGPETKAKMRAAQLGRKHTPETLQKMSEVQRGHSTSDEARRKMSAARKGRVSPAKGKKWSVEARLKISLARKGRPSPLKGVKLTEEHKQNIRAALGVAPHIRTAERTAAAKANAIKAREALRRPVKCLDDGRVFDSSNHADRFYGFAIGSVNRVVRGRTRSTHGARFEYAVKE